MRFQQIPRSILTTFLAFLAITCRTPGASAATWDNSSGNNQWSTATNWLDNTVPTINDPVTFPAIVAPITANVTLSTNSFASTLTINDNYTFSAGNLNLGADVITVPGGKTATFASVLLGTGGLTK